MSTENAAGKQRGRPFQKGQSGNPDGRPKGSRSAPWNAGTTMNDSKSPNTEPTKTLVYSPDRWKGELTSIGGSKSDEWNNLLANQAMRALWLKNSDAGTRTIR